MNGGDGRIDQIVFASTELSLIGGSGMGPVATSLTKHLEGWSRLFNIGDLLAGSWPDLDDPDARPAFGWLLLGEQRQIGAVLRLLPARDGGRPSHILQVLFGDAAHLDRELAFELYGWEGWLKPGERPNPELPALTAGELRAWASAMAEPPNADREPAVHLIAGILTEPSRDYSAVLDRGVEPLPLVQRALRIVDGISGRAPWTILFGAQSNLPEAQPRLVFLDHPPKKWLGPGRVPLEAGGARPEFVREARFLLDAQADFPRPEQPVTTGQEFLDWIERERHRIVGVIELLRSAIRNDLTQEQHEYLLRPAGRELVGEKVAEISDQTLLELLRGWSGILAYPEITAELRTRALHRSFTADVPELPKVLRGLRQLHTRNEISTALVGWYHQHPNASEPELKRALDTASQLGLQVATEPAAAPLLAQMSPLTLLKWCAGATSEGAIAPAQAYLRFAEHRRLAPAEMQGCHQLVRSKKMLRDTIPQLVSDPTDPSLYLLVTRLAYGHPLRSTHVEELMLDVGTAEVGLLVALNKAAADDAKLVLAAYAARQNAKPGEWYDVLDRLTDPELAVIAAEPRQHSLAVLRLVLDQLVQRGHDDQSHCAGIAKALSEHGQLVPTVQALHPDDADDQWNAHGKLLSAGYPHQLDGANVAEILRNVQLPYEPLVAAIRRRAGQEGRAELNQWVTQTLLKASGLSQSVLNAAWEQPGTFVPPVEPPRPGRLERAKALGIWISKRREWLRCRPANHARKDSSAGPPDGFGQPVSNDQPQPRRERRTAERFRIVVWIVTWTIIVVSVSAVVAALIRYAYA